MTELERTLIIIPCSGAKRGGGRLECPGPSVIDSLPQGIGDALRLARHAVAAKAAVDESELLPALQRYQGHLYQAARHELLGAVDRGFHLLILSGGYGILHACEPIGNYQAIFNRRWWPPGLLEEVLTNYLRAHHLTHVRAVVSASTSYRRLVESVNWHAAGAEDAVLLTPLIAGGGAMVKAPRAQGEAMAALLTGRLSDEWRSSDGVALQATKLEATARPRR